MRLVFKKTRYTLAVLPSATTCSSTVVSKKKKKSGHPSFDIKEPHGVESYTVERTQIIMGCAGPREDVSCSVITAAGQGKRGNRREDIRHCIPSPKLLRSDHGHTLSFP